VEHPVGVTARNGLGVPELTPETPTDSEPPFEAVTMMVVFGNLPLFWV
jgi:hypothetical protein